MSNPADTWVCIASGPSLFFEDVEYCRLRGYSMATCNSSWPLVRDAKIFHACDKKWWDANIWDVGFDCFLLDVEQTWTGSREIANVHEDIKMAERKEYGGWSDEPGVVYSGGQGAGNTGYQLIQIVGWRKPERILLLGYDMQPDDSGAMHWHDDYPEGMHNMPNTERQLPYYNDMARDCPYQIINCTRSTVIKSFPQVPLRELP